MNSQSSTQNQSPDLAVDVLIVGAGFSGLCSAIKLKEAGLDSFLVIEKDDEIGGTWYENQYPGCACDIPSHLYCFSFDGNPEWSRMYATQPEIRNYLQSVVQRYGLMPSIRLNTELKAALWDDAEGRWHATTGKGENISARVLILGMGALHIPHYPEIKGVERFAGPAFHSSHWDHSVALDGKNVAVIGTGASAIQFVPQIAPCVGKLALFQRTPPWIFPKPDHAISEKWRQWFRRVPGLMSAFRASLFWGHEFRVLGFLGRRRMQEMGEQMALRHLEKQIPDPTLRAALKPNYELGCKRVLISNDFYPTLRRENVELVVEPIKEITEHSIIMQSGEERPADVLIYGTGFRATEPLVGTCIVGRGNIEIHDAWCKRVSAYLGITVSGFPNLFLLLGPNTGLGHNSVVLMIEAQVGYVVNCLKLMRRQGKRVMEVKADSQQKFVEEVRRRLVGTVWQSGGCRSWYQDQTGENPTIWPGSVVAYQRRVRAVAAADYELR